jgi:hypothetical protein
MRHLILMQLPWMAMAGFTFPRSVRTWAPLAEHAAIHLEIHDA